MTDRLAGKVAVVTGSGRGIGKAEAIALARDGAHVVVNDLGVARDGLNRSSDPADETVQEIRSLGGSASANYDDVSTMEGGASLIGQAVREFGRIDIIVNNAGIQLNRPVTEITDDEWDRTIAIHVRGHWSTIKAALPHMQSQGSGCIINTASMAGLGQLRHVDYVTAKEAIVGMTRALALELAPYGIRVNNIRPRATTRMITERRPEEMGDSPPPPTTSMASRDPATLGSLVVFLASEAAAHISGNDFFAQGDEVSIMSLPQKVATAFLPAGWTTEDLERVFDSSFGSSIRKPIPY